MADQGACSRIEQRSVIKFLVAEGCKPSEIHRRMSTVYDTTCFSQKNVYKWAKLFKEGRSSVQDEDRPGRPAEVRSPAVIKSVNDLIQSDRRVTVDDIARSLSLSVGTAHKIVHDDLAYSKVSCRWVPKMLTPEHKQRRIELSQQCLSRYEKDGDDFLNRVVTCDETWVWHYEPESKRQSMEWKHTNSPVKKKFKSQRSTGKVMLTVFWDMQGPITISYLEKGTTVNGANYCELLRQVKKDIKNKRRGRQSQGVILHQDNARPHTAAETVKTINELGWELLPHPPYSPDLAPSDFYLFGPLKEFTRGTKFESDGEVKSAVSDWLKCQSKDFYAEGIHKLVYRWNKCVSLLGDYVEK